VHDERPEKIAEQFKKDNPSLDFSVEKSTSDLMCGLKWIRDSGGYRVFEARRATTVWVNTGNGRIITSRITVSMRKGDTLNLHIATQGFSCP
jgi:hypothetical protein